MGGCYKLPGGPVEVMTPRRIVKRTRVGRGKSDGTVMKPLLRAYPLGGGKPGRGTFLVLCWDSLMDIVMFGKLYDSRDVQ